ncbi:unnamed protein product, partial [Meganyctiphanes norvegica]
MRVFLILSVAATLASAKIFDKCELADVLETKHSMPRDQVKNWVCIAQYESTFNTEAINKFNWDGSMDYGLFQLNNKYWCKDEDENPSFQNVCRMSCSKLLDADLTDDLACIKRIVRETESWKGKGTALTSWVAYVNKCQNRNLDEYMSECWAGDNVIGHRGEEGEQESNIINVESNVITVRDETPEDTNSLEEGIINSVRIPLLPMFHAFPYLQGQHPILTAQQPLVLHRNVPQMNLVNYHPQQVPTLFTKPYGFVYRRF